MLEAKEELVEPSETGLLGRQQAEAALGSQGSEWVTVVWDTSHTCRNSLARNRHMASGAAELGAAVWGSRGFYCVAPASCQTFSL